MRSHSSRGYTLVEMLVYVAILSFLMVVLIGSIVVIINSFTRVRVVRAVAEVGGGALERIVREIRQASAITTAGSAFDSSPGVLQLATTDSNGDDTAIVFALSGNDLTIQEGVNATSTLLGGPVYVSSLIFRQLSTTTASGVKIELSLADERLPGMSPITFYTTAVLRGSY